MRKASLAAGGDRLSSKKSRRTRRRLQAQQSPRLSLSRCHSSRKRMLRVEFCAVVGHYRLACLGLACRWPPPRSNFPTRRSSGACGQGCRRAADRSFPAALRSPPAHAAPAHRPYIPGAQVPQQGGLWDVGAVARRHPSVPQLSGKSGDLGSRQLWRGACCALLRWLPDRPIALVAWGEQFPCYPISINTRTC
jgi:hypothetical protein